MFIMTLRVSQITICRFYQDDNWESIYFSSSWGITIVTLLITIPFALRMTLYELKKFAWIPFVLGMTVWITGFVMLIWTLAVDDLGS